MKGAVLFCVFLLLLFSGMPTMAQVTPAMPGHALRFQHITTANGLSDNSVTCLFEDREGYIWVGTEHGLNRYDGQRVMRYAGTSAPRGIRISSIAQDSSGTIWVSSTDGGLSRYDPKSDSFSGFMQVHDANGALPTDRLNHLLALNDSMLLISTQNACLLWCNTKARTYRKRDYNMASLTVNDTVGRWCHSTLRLDDERIWLGLIPGKNSFILDAQNGSVLHDVLSTNADSLHSLTNAIQLKGNILAGGWGPGITRVSLVDPESQHYAPLDDELTAMVPWHDGSVLAGTKINGLLVLDDQLQLVQHERHRRNDRTSIGDNQVRCLLKDHHGNIWVGTSGGVSVHAASVWPMAVKDLFPQDDNEQPDLTFHRLQQDADGTIRISSSHGFFTLKDPQSEPRHIRLSHQGRNLELTGLFRTGPKEYFVGTETGLFPYDPSSELLITRPHTSAPSPFSAISMFQVRSAFADTLGGKRKILVGALGFGVSILDPAIAGYEDDNFILVMDPSLSLTSCTVLDSSTGRYWSGTSKGIYSWSAQHATRVDTALTFLKKSPAERRLPGEDVSAIIVRNGIAWATLREGFLVTIERGKVKSHAVPKHMPSDLQGLAFDGRGRIWCPTSDGLLRFDPRDNSWLRVPVNDGGRFRQLNSSILLLRDGTMALCADNSLITFDPSALDDLPMLPEPRVIGIRNAWGAISTDSEGRLRLPYRSSSFEADLSALWPTGPAPLEFLYRLDGSEQTSHVTTAGGTMRYAGVPAGEHRLLVRVRDAYGREGPELAVLTLSIAAPLWQRWWIYALLVLIAAAVMFAWSRYRLGENRKMQAVRDGIARDLHDDIGSTLGSISYYSEALKRRLGKQDPIAQEVADKIGANSREMIGRMSDIVWSVDPKNDDAGSLSYRMKSYARDLLAARDIVLSFQLGPGLSACHLGTQVRRSLFLIFKEAVHNAMKYSECTSMEVSLHCDGRMIVMAMIDNGIGFDPAHLESYNGNGLPSIRARAESQGGKAEITSIPGAGTTVRISVPLNTGIPRSGGSS